jgi:hypothetical protein
LFQSQGGEGIEGDGWRLDRSHHVPHLLTKGFVVKKVTTH